MVHTILCAKNHAVDYLISKCLNALQGEVQTYHSAESAILNGDSQENNQHAILLDFIQAVLSVRVIGDHA